jgi:hypothetical protein
MARYGMPVYLRGILEFYIVISNRGVNNDNLCMYKNT